MSEDAIMEDNNVTITKTLAIVNGVSYPTNTISAISVREVQRGGGWIIWIIILGLVALGSIQYNIVISLIAAAIIGLIIFLRPKVSFNLMVRSAGADTSILASADSAYLGKVKAAIEEAVRRRG